MDYRSALFREALATWPFPSEENRSAEVNRSPIRFDNPAERRVRDVRLSFEPADIVNEVMSFGSPTPVEVQVSGPKMADNRSYAAKIFAELSKVPSLREGHSLRHPDSDFLKQITKRGDGMPAFKDKLKAEEIDDLIRFIRHEFQAGMTPPAETAKPMKGMK